MLYFKCPFKTGCCASCGLHVIVKQNMLHAQCNNNTQRKSKSYLCNAHFPVTNHNTRKSKNKNWRGSLKKALSDSWSYVKFSFSAQGNKKAICLANLTVNQTSFRVFFHTPLHLLLNQSFKITECKKIWFHTTYCV